jgi:lipopolysaccharide/colanic/teichoic acid biosynthesis glycosyltransferase
VTRCLDPQGRGRPGGMGLLFPLVRAERHLRAAPGVSPRTHREGARRLLNVVVATLAIALTFPLMLLIAALVTLSSRGPVILVQTRVGLDRRALTGLGGNTRRRFDYGGRLFPMLKFRTMFVDRTPRAQEVWAAPNDARVTPVGRILRRFRLDELPQLFNVLRGDMNVVGPRPEQPAIFVALRVRIEGYERRQRVRPGISGWAQVNRGYDDSVDDVRAKLAFDLHYIRRQSALEDLKVMLRTVPVMLFQRGR